MRFLLIYLICGINGTNNLNQYFSNSPKSNVNVADSLGNKGISVSTVAEAQPTQQPHRNGII